jgi:hypothetical protein
VLRYGLLFNFMIMKYEVRCSNCDAHLFTGVADTGIDAIAMADSCDCICVDGVGASIENCYVTTLG